MNTLIIFLKYPEPGKVKTRLAKDLGNEQAASIYSRMAQTIIDNVLDPTSYETAIFFDPPDKQKEITEWLRKKELQYSPQEGNTLGDKISNAFNIVFNQGSEKTVIIGTDCIDITSETINRTMDLLNDKDVVLGPAEDGGYYLLGLKKFIPQIFQNIDWSTEYVLEQTIEKINNNELKFELLKTLKDIDTLDDINDDVRELINIAELSS